MLTAVLVSPIFAPAANAATTAAIDVSIHPGSGNVALGDSINYTLGIRNSGDVPLTDATLTDTIPDGAIIISAGGGRVSGNTVTWAIGAIGVRSGHNILLTLKFPSPPFKAGDIATNSLNGTATGPEDQHLEDDATATNTLTGSASTTTTYHPTKDTYVDSSNPETTFGSAEYNQLDSGDRTERSLWAFSVTVAAGSHVSSATFSCYAGSSNSSGAQVYGTTTSWTEATAKWNNRPTVGAHYGDTGPVTSGAYTSTVSVTSAITGTGTFAFLLKTTSTVQWGCAARERTSDHPAKLTVTTVANN